MTDRSTLEFKHYQNLIDGQWIDSTSDDRITLYNPATEEALGTIPAGSVEDVDRAVAAAKKAHDAGIWRRMGWRERSRIIRRVGEVMMQRLEEIAVAETLDQGRPIRQSKGMMVPLSANAWDYFASAMMTFTGQASHPEPWVSGYTMYQPVGVVGCITPANVPLVLGSEKLAPALAAGNCVVIKPPPECPISTILLVECMLAAGIPDGVVNLVLGAGVTGQRIAEHMDIGMVAFTGSTETGRRIMQSASGNIKKLLLELGGKAPQVVFADADIDAAVEGAMWGAYLNGGQICMATTRVLVQDSAYEAFVDKFVAKTKKLRVGAGINPDSDLGPMVSDRIRDRVESYITQAQNDGATAVTGGELLRNGEFSKGFWVQPTVFIDVDSQMSITREEVFGPVPIIQRFSTMQDAIRMANDTDYGLVGSVWTNDLLTSLTVAEEVQAGYVWINDHLVRAPGFPFGGWKQSGVGREAASQTLAEFSQVKTVFIDRTGMANKPRYHVLYPG